MPLTTPQGHVLGALCAIDSEPRTWMPGDAATLRDLATMTIAETMLRQLARAMDTRIEGETAAREAAQAEKRRLESLRKLASSISHEFAGLMQAVQSGMRLVAARIEADPATARSLVALLDDVARRGGALAERLRLFVRREERSTERVNIGKLLHRVARAESGLSNLGIRTSVILQDQLPEVLVDPEEMRALLMVLLAEARTAMPEGGALVLTAESGVVEAGTSHRIPLRPGRYVRLSIADTGTGVSESWPTAAEATTLSCTNTSVVLPSELALASDLAEQLGGALLRESEPGHGGTLTFWLPAADDPELVAAISRPT
jgi:signal transduction histidine kinase